MTGQAQVNERLRMSARPGKLELSEIKVFFESLTPESLDQIGRIYASEARFKDPFQSVQGQDAIRAVFEHMFRVQPRSRFVVQGITQSQRDETLANAHDQCCLQWEYWLEISNKPACIKGCSWLILDENGKIILHRDYWDAAEELYEKIPVLGWLMRWLRRKIVSG